MMSTGYKATIHFSDREEVLERTFWHPETAQTEAQIWALKWQKRAKDQGKSTLIVYSTVEPEEASK